jgi:hypothetical protein
VLRSLKPRVDADAAITTTTLEEDAAYLSDWGKRIEALSHLIGRCRLDARQTIGELCARPCVGADARVIS